MRKVEAQKGGDNSKKFTLLLTCAKLAWPPICVVTMEKLFQLYLHNNMVYSAISFFLTGCDYS